MHKKIFIISILVSLFVLSSCEKQIDDGKDNGNTEESVTPPDDNGDSGSGGKDNGGDTGGKDNNGGGDIGGNDDDGGGSGPGSGGNSGSEGGSNMVKTGDVVSVNQFLTLSNIPMVYVEGYVVGACSGSLNSAEFAPDFTKSTSILVADDVNEKDTKKVVPIKRPTKNVGVDLNLVSNPELWHKKIRVPGYQSKYYGTIGINDVCGLCCIVDE